MAPPFISHAGSDLLSLSAALSVGSVSPPVGSTHGAHASRVGAQAITKGEAPRGIYLGFHTDRTAASLRLTDTRRKSFQSVIQRVQIVTHFSVSQSVSLSQSETGATSVLLCCC